jgi:hypothetical protein
VLSWTGRVEGGFGDVIEGTLGDRPFLISGWSEMSLVQRSVNRGGRHSVLPSLAPGPSLTIPGRSSIHQCRSRVDSHADDEMLRAVHVQYPLDGGSSKESRAMLLRQGCGAGVDGMRRRPEGRLGAIVIAY